MLLFYMEEGLVLPCFKEVWVQFTAEVAEPHGAQLHRVDTLEVPLYMEAVVEEAGAPVRGEGLGGLLCLEGRGGRVGEGRRKQELLVLQKEEEGVGVGPVRAQEALVVLVTLSLQLFNSSIKLDVRN
jgi:hypothetical protein